MQTPLSLILAELTLARKFRVLRLTNQPVQAPTERKSPSVVANSPAANGRSAFESPLPHADIDLFFSLETTHKLGLRIEDSPVYAMLGAIEWLLVSDD